MFDKPADKPVARHEPVLRVAPKGNLWWILFPPKSPREDFETLVECCRAIGAKWDALAKVWVLAQYAHAEALAKHATFATSPTDLLQRINRAAIEALNLPALDTSDPTALTPVGLSLEPHQLAGVEFIASHEASLMAWDMRVGKTPLALSSMNACNLSRPGSAWPSLIICPAHLKRNWYNEAKRWLIPYLQPTGAPADANGEQAVALREPVIGIASGDYFPPLGGLGAVDLVIINYDILDRHKAILDSTPWVFAFIDEIHRVKNPKAKRTRCIIGGHRGTGKEKVKWRPLRAKRRIGLSGTPLVNKPQDLWAQCHWLDPKNWPSYYWFQEKFCEVGEKCIGYDRVKGRPRMVRDVQAPDRDSPKLKLLNRRLNGTIMHRLTDSVLNLLPPQRQVIEVDVPDARLYIEQEQRERERILETPEAQALKAAVAEALITADEQAYRLAVRQLADYVKREGDAVFAVLRQKIALAKVPYVLQLLEDELLDDTLIPPNPGAEFAEPQPRKFLVFAHHHSVIQALEAGLSKLVPGGVVTYYGGVSEENKALANQRLNTDPTCRVFIGGITSAGEGLDLAVADDVIFAEEDPVPSNMRQCAARAKKRGKVRQNFERHVVATGSVDSHIAKLAIRKQDTADTVMDSGLTLDEDIDWLEAHQEAIQADQRQAQRQAASAQRVTSRMPTQAELDAPPSPGAMAACLYGLRRMVKSPRDFSLSDADLIVASRLAAHKTLEGRAANYAHWLIRKYLGASPETPVELPDRRW